MSAKTGFPDDVVDLIWDRDKGSCVKCGRGLHRAERGFTWAVHHRQPRGRGGAGKRRPWVNLAANGILLCNECHDEVESNRRIAFAEGFLVSGLGLLLPAEVPLVHATHGLVALDDLGGWELAA